MASYKAVRSNHQTGFTIIEVLIVLAIAGVILVIVFIAIPQMQRTSRNYRRKRVVSAVISSLGDYQVLTKGEYPRDYQTEAMCSLIQNYTADFVGKVPECSSGFVGGVPDRECILAEGSNGYTVCMQSQNSGSHYYRGPYDEIVIQVGHWCVAPDKPLDPNDVGNNAIVTSQHQKPPDFRIISVRTALEDGYDFCLDNSRVVFD